MVNFFSHQSHAELLAMNMWGCGLWVFASYLLYRCRKARVIRLAADKILGTYITPQVDCVGLHPWIGSCCPGRLLFERWADPNQQEPLVPLLHLCHGRHGLLPSHAPLSRDRRLQVLGWCSFALSWQVPAINLLLV